MRVASSITGSRPAGVRAPPRQMPPGDSGGGDRSSPPPVAIPASAGGLTKPSPAADGDPQPVSAADASFVKRILAGSGNVN